MNKFGLHTFSLPSFGISDFRLTSFGGDGDGGRKAALPSPDLYYDLSFKSNEHPTRNIIDDMSGNGRHATIYNALYAKGSGYGEPGYEGAFVFDGIDDYASIENITKGFKTLFMEVVPFKTGGILFEQRMMDAVQIGGRNLISNIPNNWVKGYYIPSTGRPVFGGYNHNSLKERISCEPNNYYTMSSPKRMVALQYDGDDVYIQPIIDKGENSTLTFKTHSSARYLRFYILLEGEPNELNLISEYKLKIEKGNKATDWSPAPEDVFAISNLPNTIAYNERNPNGVTYINGELNTNKYTDDMQNHRQVITIVNPTDTTDGSASIGAAFNFSEGYSSMALYKVIGFYDELTPAQIQRVITKYNLKYEQI